ncbi:MAG: hypothetical protein ACLSHW_12105 [Lachnospiraceae bacterium]
MKRAGLVLEGGANRGVFTSGALDYLMEQDFLYPVCGWNFRGCVQCGGLCVKAATAHKEMYHYYG